MVFERFTESARKVVVLAQEEARALGHNYIGTEHILLGLLREQGIAAQVLESLGVTVERARDQTVRIVGGGQDVRAGQIPFTPRAKKVLELALRESLSLGHNYIGDEHVLLGLVRENDGVATRILLDFDADSEKIRTEVIRRLSGPDYRPPRAAHASAGGVVIEQDGFVVRPDAVLRRLLMAAGGRALINERSEFGLEDLLAVAEGLADPETPPDSEPQGSEESDG
jgi:ATP-dependent Clp protease ATP-binding subunit ClpC